MFSKQDDLTKALRDCHARLSEGTSLQDCLDLYPQFASEIAAHFGLLRELSGARVNSPPAAAVQNGRRMLLSALAANPSKEKGPMFASPLSKIAAGLLAGFVLGSMTLGAAAQTDSVHIPGPVGDLLTNLGVQQERGPPEHVRDMLRGPGAGFDGPGGIGTQQFQINQDEGLHGMSVSEAVMNTLAEYRATYGRPGGPGLGQLVCEAARATARDRSTLPFPANQIEPDDPDNEPPCGAGNGVGPEDENGGPPATIPPAQVPGGGPPGPGGQGPQGGPGPQGGGPPTNVPPAQVPGGPN